MKEKTHHNDILWFSIVAILILVFGSIPYWTAQLAQTSDLRFLGTYFDETDYAANISMMHAGEMGEWAYQMRFTSEESRPAFLRMFYILLGHVSKWFQLNVETTYHIARWVFGFVALYSIYQLCLKAFSGRKQARAAFLLTALGSGLGWLQLMLGAPLEPISPIDFWLIDTYVFFSISLFPAFSFTLALMAGAVTLYMDFLNTGKWKIIPVICLLTVASQITNPIAFAAIDLSFAGVIIFSWWKNKKVVSSQFYVLCVIAIAQIPLLAYNFIVLSKDPLWSNYTLQNQTLSPPPAYFFWGLAPFCLFAIWGIIRAFYEKNENIILLAIWSLTAILLAYSPVLIQRRFTIGLTIPLGILAIYGLQHLIQLTSAKYPALTKREDLISFAYVLTASISTIYLILGSSLFMQTRPTGNFYSQDLENAFIWLDENAKPNEFLLGSTETGQLAAQRTKLKVYIGHEIETLYFENKKDAVEAYYTGSAAGDWVQHTPIQWVIYGPYEKNVSEIFIPYPDLEIMYENDTVKIYKVSR